MQGDLRPGERLGQLRARLSFVRCPCWGEHGPRQCDDVCRENQVRKLPVHGYLLSRLCWVFRVPWCWYSAVLLEQAVRFAAADHLLAIGVERVVDNPVRGIDLVV